MVISTKTRLFNRLKLTIMIGFCPTRHSHFLCTSTRHAAATLGGVFCGIIPYPVQSALSWSIHWWLARSWAGKIDSWRSRQAFLNDRPFQRFSRQIFERARLCSAKNRSPVPGSQKMLPGKTARMGFALYRYPKPSSSVQFIQYSLHPSSFQLIICGYR